MLLIYSLPSQPSRKRAYVWRELKRLGAIYLRDGVALLPQNPLLEKRLHLIVERINAYEGVAELVLAPTFSDADPQRFVQRFQADRADEYRELYRECVHFLRDVLEEVDARDFAFPDVDKLESELGRLQRWSEQIRERDYFAAPGFERVREMLAKCERAFDTFASHASETDDVEHAPPRDDVFERLGGPGASTGPQVDELRL
ncbi:MAG: hypothetical protein NVS2B16_13370 [Chloroflexota bacterium]